MKQALTDELAREIRTKHHAGMSIADLNREYGLSRWAIKQLLLGRTYRDAGGQIGIFKHTRIAAPKRIPKLTQTQKDEIRAQVANGVSQGYLHRKYGVSRAYISRIVKGSR